MVTRTTTKIYDSEPEQIKNELPSEKEHLLQVVDIFTYNDETGRKLKLDEDTVSVKLEVCSGEEEGRTLLNRLNLNEDWKGFFATRLFLKAIGEEYKGKGFTINTDNWIGKQFYATVTHSKDGKYANIDKYNFDKIVEQPVVSTSKLETKEEKEKAIKNSRVPFDEISWDEDK